MITGAPRRPTRFRPAGIVVAAAGLLLGVLAAGRPGRLPVARETAFPAPPRRADPAAVLAGAAPAFAAAAARHGAESREVATLLGATAQTLWDLEAYDEALPLAERALAIRQRTDPDTPVLAGELYQVGDLHRALGDFAGALRRLEEARDLWARTLGPRSPEVAAALHYLGVVHQITGDAPGARSRLEEALSIRLERFGEDHEQVAATLVALSGLAAETGDAPAADRLQARALAIWERLDGPDHPMVARGLSGWAARRAAAGDLAGARALLERALAIRVRAFGEEHHLVARTEADLAAVSAREGDVVAAGRLYRDALDRSRRLLDADHPQVIETLLGLARLAWGRGARAEAVASALDAEALARRRFLRTARGLADGEALQYETLRDSGLGLALTALAEPPAGGADASAVRRIVGEMFRSRALVLDRLTRRGAGASPATDPASLAGADAAGDAPGAFEAVRRALPEGAALVAYARYQRVDSRGFEAGGSYLAVILRAGAAAPEILPLGDAQRLDAAVTAWRAVVSVDPRLRSSTSDGGRAAAERVRALLWDPIAARVAGAAPLLIVPDGAIHAVSFAALPAAGGAYLIETAPPFHYLGAERDLERLRDPGRHGRGALLIGDVDFDAPARAPGDPVPRAGPPPSPGTFGPLPGTRAEIGAVAALAAAGEEATLLTGADATVAAFRARAPGRRLLHLATHAWFLPADGAPAGAPAPASAAGDEAGTTLLADRRLLASGIAFAGADVAPGDGIMTADQIAALDLSSVEWAVLSGCDGGAGHVVAGEGVVGLRRAFERAGARTVIMSLWRADDGAALAWMRALYRARAAGRSTPEAVRDAGLALLRDPRHPGTAVDPYFWAPFVAAGDWR